MRKRGIVLISSLVLAVVLMMFVGAALALGPGNLAAGQSSIYRLEAERAAQSGIDYALAQLRLDPTWRGDKNQVTVDTPDLVIEESNGNVVGLLRGQDGKWSQFKLRFNYQDGPGGADGFASDPAFSVDHPYVSVNNLTGAAPANVPRADGPGYSVSGTSPVAFEIPTWAVSLAAEGRAGLRGVDPAMPWGNYAGVSRMRVVEGVYQVNPGPASFAEAGTMAGASFLSEVKGGAVNVSSSGVATPRLRAKQGTTVTGGAGDNYVSANGEVLNGPSSLNASYDPSQVTVAGEAATDPFYALTFSSVRRAPTTGDTLPGGTYVRWQDGSLHYYNMDYATYAAHITQNPLDGGQTVTLPPSVSSVNGAVKKLVITGDVYIDPSGGVAEFNLLTREGAPEFPPGDPEAPAGGGAVTTAWAGSVFQNQNLQGFCQWIGVGQPLMVTINGPASQSIVVQYSPGSLNTSMNNATQDDMLALLCDPNALGPGWQVQVSGIQVPVDAAAVSNWAGVQPPAGGATPGSNGEINPPNVSDSLTASDLEIEFAPPPGQSAVLSSDGDIRLTGAITGTGGTITSGGDIRIVGLGATLAGQDNPVNMYARGDIFISTLDEANPGQYQHLGLNLKGIIFAQGDFKARLGSATLAQWATANIDGMLIAYGADLDANANALPGSGGKGNIDFRAESVNLNYNPAYLGALANAPPAGFAVNRLMWSNSF